MSDGLSFWDFNQSTVSEVVVTALLYEYFIHKAWFEFMYSFVDLNH